MNRDAIISRHIKNGVKILDEKTVFIDENVKIGENVTIYPMVSLYGDTIIHDGVTLFSFCDLTDTEVGEGTDVRSAFAVSAKIGARCTVGPFACLRKGANVGDGCRVGDFVEIKNSTLGAGVKCAHLAYVGDASVGSNTNIGCGTVFANYDGKVKRHTDVGSGVFIGCNSNLVAPISVADGAYIAAGSTVTHDVPENSLCIARSRQAVKSNWNRP